MKFFLAFFLLISCRISSQTYVFIPDANFLSYLHGIVPAAINGNSLNITHTLVTTSTKTMIIGANTISDLTGIQYFSSLTHLDCSNNSLSNLPPLPGSLLNLICYGNVLTSLPSLPNSLQGLDCYTNSLTALPALPNSLKGLGCGNNLLTNLPALPNSLQSLDCYSNLLTHLPALPDSLKTLNCYNNNISCFPIFPGSLTYMLIVTNPFNCLPNYVLPAMNNYTTTPLCMIGNSNECTTVGIEELNSNINQINIFPNPTTGQFTIDTSMPEKLIAKLYDLNGQLIFSKELNDKKYLDVSDLNEGVYNLTIKTTGKTINKKLTVIH